MSSRKATESAPGGYRVRRRLAAGDYAEVYLCEDGESAIALKVFHLRSQALARHIEQTPGLSVERLRRRFCDEALLLARFDHPHIVPVRSCDGLSADAPYYTMPFFPRSLAGMLRPRAGRRADPAAPVNRPPPAPLSVETATEMLRHILSGLGAVHAADIVHRDLKPDNILVDTAGTAAIGDFSLAKTPWPGYTPLREGFANHAFAAPEQAADPRAADARADIYSVGALAYTMLTGRLPAAKPAPDRINPEVGDALNGWIMDALAADPACRPGNANEALLRLNAIAAGKPG